MDEYKEVATMSRTKEIMNKFNLHTKKAFGQNFITDPNIVRKIARECNLSKDSIVIEIGPGIGALSEQLAMLAKKVVAFEIDERLLEVLAYSLSNYDNVEIRLEDFLNTNITEVASELLLMGKEVVVAANLPYYITTPILFHIFESQSCIDRIVVMMQKEVADRFTASVNTKDYNALSIITQFQYDCTQVMKVSRNVFEPKPNVDSAVVEFKRRVNNYEIEDKQTFFCLVKSCFVQRRKTIYNNFQGFCKNKEKALVILNKANIEPQRRAESCSLDEFVCLYKTYKEFE